jgi:glycosyltransferase involved in cell wall biosynthesis
LKSKKLFIVVNVEWFFLSHRLPIALAAQRQGYEVTVFATEERGQGAIIRENGLRFIPLPTTRSGTDIIQEIKVLWLLYRYYRRERPDVVHHVAVKPVTYGSIAARLAGVPRVVNALSGLGFLFINADSNKLLHSIVMRAFRFGFRNPRLRFILQNQDDYALINGLNLVTPDQIILIKGSGVDLEEYAYSAIPDSKPKIVLLPARMLWDKGVGEFVEAAKILKPKYGDAVQFILAGEADTSNRSGIAEDQLNQWSAEGAVEWIGFQSDMVGHLKQSYMVVLPSYREGLPKSLIEACAIGRPIVTTDVPGCREVVEIEKNGLLVPAKNAEALAQSIDKILSDPHLANEMGRYGRKKAEAEFSIHSVVEKTLALYE